MQLTVFGGTGGTGAALIDAALAAGHCVTAPVRDPSRLGVPMQERLRTVRADVLDPPSLAGTVDGADAVLSALGMRGNRPTTVYSAGVANILDAMRAAGVRRLVAVTAIPVTPRLRPPQLTDRPATGRYRTAVNQHLRGAKKISRTDLAEAMLRQLDEPTSVHATVGVAY